MSSRRGERTPQEGVQTWLLSITPASRIIITRKTTNRLSAK